MTESATTAGVPAPNPFVSRFLGILFPPRETFAAVVAHPTWVGMLALSTLVAALCMWALLSTEAGQEAVIDQSVSSIESWGRSVDDAMYAQLEKQASIAKYVNPVAILVIAPLMTFLIAGILLGVFNTLLGGDSDYLWGRFLVEQGIVDGDSYERENQRFYDQYKAGTLDIQAFLAFSLRPLASVAAHNSLGMGHIQQFGSDEQRRMYLPKLARGEWLGAWGLTEPTAGSDAGGTRTTATRDGDHWVLNGSKTFTTNAAVGHVAIVFASTDPSRKHDGISALIVEKGTKGFSVGKHEDKLGMRASDTSEVVLQDCRIPRSALIGREGEGFRQPMKVLDGGRISIAALGVGIAAGALGHAVRYAAERQQFGKPIGAFQAIQAKISGSQQARTEQVGEREWGLLQPRHGPASGPSSRATLDPETRRSR